jgi:hypothetical protein
MDSSGVGIWQFVVSVVVAVVFSDVAAVVTTLIYQKRENKKARLMALRSLLNEVKRIQKAAEHNAGLQPRAPPHDIARMPVAAFETAFVSGKPGLSVSSDLLDASMEYLARADSINSLVEIYLNALGGESSRMAGERKQAVEKVVEVCTDELLAILDSLSDLLQAELEEKEDQ